MKHNGWFGKSWGAPVCNPEDHVETPVGENCLWCNKPIESGDQGLTAIHISADSATTRASHLDCFLKKIMAHNRNCPRCRGLNRNDHAENCNYRLRGQECNCIN